MLLTIVDLVAGAVTAFLAIVFLVRFFMQVHKVSFRNPVGQFVVAASDWAVLPLRRLLPPVAGLDTATLALTYLVEWIGLLVVQAVAGGLPAALPAITIVAVFESVRMAVYLAIGLMLVQAVLSWVNPLSPIAGPVTALTRPLLRPVRKVLPPIAQVDLSPLVGILLAQVALAVLAYIQRAAVAALI